MILRGGYFSLKTKLGLNNKKIVLGVASVWDYRKGLDTMIELSSILAEEYKMILVGLDQKQLKSLPNNVIGINRTNDIEELRQLYAIADFFVNPTLEDNYPTTNLEAASCGTPTITFRTGGSPESASFYGVTTKNKNIFSIMEALKVDLLVKSDFDVSISQFVEKVVDTYDIES